MGCHLSVVIGKNRQVIPKLIRRGGLSHFVPRNQILSKFDSKRSVSVHKATARSLGRITLMFTKALLSLFCGLLLPFTISARPAPSALSGRECLSFDPGWRFNLGDIPFPIVRGHGATYLNAKAGNASGAAAPAYDDTGWREVNLPHDWAVEQPFDKEANVSQGYRARGIGWYRKSFRLDSADKGKSLELQFDGVATHCTVWLNGTVVHRNWCGYTSFSIDLTPFARFGEELNTVAIRVDAETQEGWWYEGAGIYRHTWLVKRAPVHLITDGVFAQPVKDAAGTWNIPVAATIANIAKDAFQAEVETVVIDPAGQPVASGKGAVTVAPLDEALAKFSIPVQNPKLWSLDTPILYTVRTTVKLAGAPVDETVTHCGFRTIRFDTEKGFFLNDKPVKIKGTCNHIDHAGVGVAVPDSIWDFRLRKLKEMGSNAVRCSHNPPAKEFLDLCDKLGVLVMDENRNFNCSPEYVRQLQWMVVRDRNHPSIILWSVFNEEPMQASEQGYEMVRRMAAVVKKLDTSRPVTAAMNGGLGSPVNVSQAVDVVGFNYQQNGYDNFHRGHPNQPISSSEDTSAVMTRGEFRSEKKKNILGSYDTEYPGWGSTHRDAWKAIASREFVAGGFVWTGFDYRGEPTPFTWPSAGSFFGCMDLCGFPKSAFYMHQAHWISDRPVVQLIPHWNWPGEEGKPIQVTAISNADTIALSLNGKDLGEKPVDPIAFVSWTVPYEAGKLVAIAKRAGKEIGRSVVETTGAPAAIRLEADRTTLKGDGLDAVPVTASVVDSQGRVIPTGGPMVRFVVEGPGEVIGLGNGDPNCHEPEKGDRHSLFNGLGQVILRGKAGGSGSLVLHAESAGLKGTTVTLSVASASPVPALGAVSPILSLDKWRMSPVSTSRPDPTQEVAQNDQNSWQPVTPGRLPKLTGGSYAVFRSEKFKPYAAQRRDGGQIQFGGITGKAEVWLDGKKIGEKTTSEPAPFSVVLPAGDKSHVLNVLVQGTEGHPAGLSGSVKVNGR